MVIAALKTLQRSLSKRVYCVIVMLTAAAAVFAISTIAQFKSVTINIDGKKTTITTCAKSVESVLKQKGISLGENDEIHPPLVSDTSKGMTITIDRAFQVPFVLGTDSFQITTTPKTLKEIIDTEGIILGEHDIVNPSLDTVVTKGTKVNITRVSVGDVIETEVIPYGKTTVPNSEMERGQSKVVTEGVDGSKELVYRVTVSNGEETDRTFVGERVITEPIDEVTEYGTKTIQPVDRSTTTDRTTKPASAPPASQGVPSGVVEDSASAFAGATYYDCKATSYIINGKTASGLHTQRGIIAVDPKVIPLGTRVYVQSLDGKPDYGYAIAADTGGAIKGNKIDLWVPTYEEACYNGVRQMRVYILP